MPSRPRAWLAREAGSPRRAAIIGLVFLAAALVAALAGNLLSAAISGVGAVLMLVAYLATYGVTRSSRERSRPS
ncbi:MAG: hypothetical protein QOD86_2166 [Miltoncostaeaceae bacterium]|jgi:4-hydroxybenzoate polyprenyltransferase|nr:hypothetical protein [Miltoncostaeaceae bacterium]